jgi:hypothetical protein
LATPLRPAVRCVATGQCCRAQLLTGQQLTAPASAHLCICQLRHGVALVDTWHVAHPELRGCQRVCSTCTCASVSCCHCRRSPRLALACCLGIAPHVLQRDTKRQHTSVMTMPGCITDTGPAEPAGEAYRTKPDWLPTCCCRAGHCCWCELTRRLHSSALCVLPLVLQCMLLATLAACSAMTALQVQAAASVREATVIWEVEQVLPRS